MIAEVAEADRVLSLTPETLSSWLSALPDSLVSANEGAGTWSARDVVGHLLQGEEEDWMPRMKIVLDRGEAQTFDPFDPNAFLERYRGLALSELLDRFTMLRAKNLTALRTLSLSQADLALTGTHPAFGRVTLAELLRTWVVHDLAHIAQIARVMARHLGDGVGPWREFLPVLHR